MPRAFGGLCSRIPDTALAVTVRARFQAFPPPALNAVAGFRTGSTG